MVARKQTEVTLEGLYDRYDPLVPSKGPMRQGFDALFDCEGVDLRGAQALILLCLLPYSSKRTPKTISQVLHTDYRRVVEMARDVVKQMQQKCEACEWQSFVIANLKAKANFLNIGFDLQVSRPASDENIDKLPDLSESVSPDLRDNLSSSTAIGAPNVLRKMIPKWVQPHLRNVFLEAISVVPKEGDARHIFNAAARCESVTAQELQSFIKLDCYKDEYRMTRDQFMPRDYVMVVSQRNAVVSKLQEAFGDLKLNEEAELAIKALKPLKIKQSFAEQKKARPVPKQEAPKPEIASLKEDVPVHSPKPVEKPVKRSRLRREMDAKRAKKAVKKGQGKPKPNVIVIPPYDVYEDLLRMQAASSVPKRSL